MMTKLKVLRYTLLSLLTFAETVYGQEDCHCDEVAYLQRGMKGKIPCQCNDFSLVSWYRSEEDYDDGGIPFIKYENSETTGTGKESGEFDVGMNGSLIITNVSMINHGKTYFFVFLRETINGRLVKDRAKVEVLVYPNPLYPVVNGYVNHQHLYLDMKRKGSLHCDMKGVHPKVNLSFTFINQRGSGNFFIEQGDPKYTQNEDNTYDVTVTANYTTDFSVQTVIIQCGVINELRKIFPENTTAEISFPPREKAYPVVNGGVDHEHVYLEMNRTGELNCNITSPDLETRLEWMVMDPSFEDTISFHNCIIKYLPRDGIFIVFLKCSYIVKDETVDRVTVRCQVTGSTSEKYPNATIVKLLFPRKAQSLSTTTLLTPVINSDESASDCQKRTSLALQILIFIVLLVFFISWCIDKVVTRMRRKKPDPPQGTECDNSSDSGDSGNFGSTTREKKGSEVFAKSDLMQNIDRSNCDDEQESHWMTKGEKETPMV